jgi:hypothetical protein
MWAQAGAVGNVGQEVKRHGALGVQEARRVPWGRATAASVRTGRNLHPRDGAGYH